MYNQNLKTLTNKHFYDTSTSFTTCTLVYASLLYETATAHYVTRAI